MSMVEVSRLSYAYGRVQALQDLDLAIPAGALYALVGPNGSGKTTLMQVLLGLRRAQQGSAFVMGRDCATLTAADKVSIGYIAEGQALPGSTLLVMDEPFTGMDALVRDELVRGLLQSTGAEGWTVLLCSHDIAEVEMLADWVGFLQKGRMRLS